MGESLKQPKFCSRDISYQQPRLEEEFICKRCGLSPGDLEVINYMRFSILAFLVLLRDQIKVNLSKAVAELTMSGGDSGEMGENVKLVLARQN
jgi:hypothetical protein